MSIPTAPGTPELTVRIFTHPACPRCGGAVKTAWEVKEQNPELFQLRTISLTDKEGLAEAHAEKIATIPTLILTGKGGELHRIVGAPAPGELEASIQTAMRKDPS